MYMYDMTNGFLNWICGSKLKRVFCAIRLIMPSKYIYLVIYRVSCFEFEQGVNRYLFQYLCFIMLKHISISLFGGKKIWSILIFGPWKKRYVQDDQVKMRHPEKSLIIRKWYIKIMSLYFMIFSSLEQGSPMKFKARTKKDYVTSKLLCEL